MKNDYSVTELIDGDGEFKVSGINNFTEDVKFRESGESYAVVAVMGPQSSGKSTLMNHLFHTDFKEMNGKAGRNQTTLGIWLAKCVGITPYTIAMDLEGSDGRERGAHTAFEKQTALFALAVSDIVLINMWCTEIGREQAANKPLLRTVFQVMMSLFGPGRKKTLLFVIRDKVPETPLDNLKDTLMVDIHKIWNEIPKPREHESTHLSECFKVEVVALPHYDYEKTKFKEEVAELRQRFFNSISPGGLAGGDRRGVVPASGFSFSAQQIWKLIKENKDLDLPSLNVMVANFRCDDIAKQKFDELTKNQDWLKLEEAVKNGPVKGFGEKLSSILDIYFNEYETEAKFFDKGVKNKKRHDVLEKRAFEYVQPAYTAMLEHIRSKAYNEFEAKLTEALAKGETLVSAVDTLTRASITEFDEGRADAAIKQDVKWDSIIIRDGLRSDIQAHVHRVYNDNIIADLKRMNLENKIEAEKKMEEIIKRLHMETKEELEETKSRLYMEHTGMHYSPENMRTGASSSYGGGGGGGWDDGRVYDGVRKLHIKSGTGLGFFSFPTNGACIVSFGATYALNGQVIKPGTHGGSGSGSDYTITLDYPKEFLTNLTGFWGPAYWMEGKPSVIQSLKFQTNVRTYGPYGDEEGTRFNFSIAEGRKVIGFHGKSGSLLDAIGVHLTKP